MELVLWWHWVVIGLVLLIIELNTGTFLFLGLGVAALLVGGLDYLVQLEFTSEILIWSVLSLLYFLAWKKWFKEDALQSIGQSDHTFDVEGVVTKAITPNKRGEVKFDTSVLGSATWVATAKEDISKDTRITIADVHGQLVEVKPI